MFIINSNLTYICINVESGYLSARKLFLACMVKSCAARDLIRIATWNSIFISWRAKAEKQPTKHDQVDDHQTKILLLVFQ